MPHLDICTHNCDSYDPLVQEVPVLTHISISFSRLRVRLIYLVFAATGLLPLELLLLGLLVLVPEEDILRSSKA